MKDIDLQQMPIHLSVDNTIYSISHDCFNYLLEYVYYDSLNRSKALSPFNGITTLTIQEFKKRNSIHSEKFNESVACQYNRFRAKNTFALNQPLISSPLDRLIPKPTFSFANSLLELDHWCQCSVYSAVKSALAIFGIVLDSSSLTDLFASLDGLEVFEKTIQDEIEIYNIQKAVLFSVIDCCDDYSKQIKAQQVIHNWACIFASLHLKSWSMADLESIFKEGQLPSHYSPEKEETHRKLVAFRQTVLENLENWEPTIKFIISLSNRHALIEAFLQCKLDIIEAISRCIPGNSFHAYPNSFQNDPYNSSASTSFQRQCHSISSSLSSTHSHPKPEPYGTLLASQRYMPYSKTPNNNLLSSATTTNSNKPNKIPNEFRKMLVPSSYTTLATFLKTFEKCRYQMLHRNNPLDPTEYYLVDAGYLSDPRSGARHTDSKKETLEKTIEFHKRLLKKEVELGYHKYRLKHHGNGHEPEMSSFDKSKNSFQYSKEAYGAQDKKLDPKVNSANKPFPILRNIDDAMCIDRLDELIDDTLKYLESDVDQHAYITNNNNNKYSSVKLSHKNPAEFHSAPNASLPKLPTIENEIWLGNNCESLSVQTINQLKSSKEEAHCYSRYYYMLAYTIRTHYFPEHQISKCLEDDEYAEIATELLSLIECYLSGNIKDLDNIFDRFKPFNTPSSQTLGAGKTLNAQGPVFQRPSSSADFSEHRRKQVDRLIDFKVQEFMKRKQASDNFDQLTFSFGYNSKAAKSSSEYILRPPATHRFHSATKSEGQIEFSLDNNYTHPGYPFLKKAEKKHSNSHHHASLGISEISGSIGSGISNLAEKMKKKKSMRDLRPSKTLVNYLSKTIKRSQRESDDDDNLTETMPDIEFATSRLSYNTSSLSSSSKINTAAADTKNPASTATFGGSYFKNNNNAALGHV